RSTIAETSLDQGRNDRPQFQVTVPASSPTIAVSMPWKIEINRDEDDERMTAGHNGDEVDDNNSSLGEKVAEDSTVDSVKTVLVPVRDPVTKKVRNVLVPVEEMDDTGLNVIKSVLIPLQEHDGSISYEIKKVVVPIKPEFSLPPRRKAEVKSLTNKVKGTQVNCKRKEEKITEEKGKVTFDTLEEAEEQEEKVRKQKETKETEKIPTDASKGEVDQILDTLRDICPFCQKRFKDENQMQKHIVKTHRKPYNCDKCHKGYFTDFALEEHQKTHEVVSFYQCTVCQMQYKTTAGLKYHQIRKHSDIDPIFTCDYCGKRFKLKLDLGVHIDRSHMNVTHICRFCGMAVKNIVYHELKHEKHKKASSLYRCSVCPRKFKAWNRLENHLLMKHKSPGDGSPDMLRTLCEKKFQSRRDFYRHVLSQSVAKQNKCVVCDKTFAFEYNLRNHVASHSHSYLCCQCGKNFTTNYLLKLHLRKHTGERPYQCKTCLKTFTRSNSLRIHSFIHTGERPYVCDLCGQSFTQKGSMTIHRRKHPGGHPPPPPPLILSRLENNEH
ncbi:unnamed protein product, partial [Heterotrigona itama]